MEVLYKRFKKLLGSYKSKSFQSHVKVHPPYTDKLTSQVNTSMTANPWARPANLVEGELDYESDIFSNRQDVQIPGRRQNYQIVLDQLEKATLPVKFSWELTSNLGNCVAL
jgi:hypothetical protein